MEKKEKMTIDKLAEMSQKEFTAIRGEIGDLGGEIGGVREDLSILRRDVEVGFSGVSEGMKAIMAKLNSIQEDVIEIHDLRSRVERLEKKVGLPR